MQKNLLSNDLLLKSLRLITATTFCGGSARDPRSEILIQTKRLS